MINPQSYYKKYLAIYIFMKIAPYKIQKVQWPVGDNHEEKKKKKNLWSLILEKSVSKC